MHRMKRIKSSTVQTMFLYWLGYLTFLVARHLTDPGDPWNKVFFHPAFLIFVPLLVACIPLLLTKPKQSVSTDDVDDENSWNLPRRTRWINPDTARRMLLAWVVSLVMFVSPLRESISYLYPILHQPLFLMIAPLLVACIIPLFVRRTVPTRRAVAETNPLSSRSFIWRCIVGSSMGFVLLIGALFLVNSLPHNNASPLWLNVLFGSGLIAIVVRIRTYVKLLKQSR